MGGWREESGDMERDCSERSGRRRKHGWRTEVKDKVSKGETRKKLEVDVGRWHNTNRRDPMGQLKSKFRLSSASCLQKFRLLCLWQFCMVP